MSIEIRRLRFKIGKGIPRYWNHACPVQTHLFNAISILTPVFERLAIASVLPYRYFSLSKELQAQLNAFIGQESAHGSEFIRFNHLLRLQGYDIKSVERKNLSQFKWLVGIFSPKMHLSFTLAAEHITAIISDVILREPNWLSHADKEVAALWRWHAIEEIEHKSVAFDVFKSIGGTYFERIGGMLLMSAITFYLLSRNFLMLMKKDKLHLNVNTWKKVFSLFWGKQGISWRLMSPLFHYFRPSFHPSNINNVALIQAWKMAFSVDQNPEKIVEILKN